MTIEIQQSPKRTDIIKLATVIDHLVDAMGDPSVTLRRTLILLDIDANAGTTQNSVCDRLALEKSVISRNIDWLFSHGCVIRSTNQYDNREVMLQTSPFTMRHLQLALRYFEGNHADLKKSLNELGKMFYKHIPSLREIKAMLSVAALGEASRSDIVNNLYNGPATTDQRVIKTLIEEGVITNDGTTESAQNNN